jgi:hypothetical protein
MGARPPVRTDARRGAPGTSFPRAWARRHPRAVPTTQVTVGAELAAEPVRLVANREGAAPAVGR